MFNHVDLINVIYHFVTLHFCAVGENLNNYYWQLNLIRSISARNYCVTGHFTQCVWKASQEIGLGKAKAEDGGWYCVGNFLPAGNDGGKNEGNVFPPKDGKIILPEKKEATPLAPGSCR